MLFGGYIMKIINAGYNYKHSADFKINRPLGSGKGTDKPDSESKPYSRGIPDQGSVHLHPGTLEEEVQM